MKKTKKNNLTHKKILVILGPTATGKTSLGIKIAKLFDGEIISADSRQVYRHMDIGTGKEWGDVKIWGYDIASPLDNFSVSEYFRQMKYVINDIFFRNKLPVIVGGTGLYIRSLIDGIQTVDIPKNEGLRKNLENMNVSEMFEKLAILDSTKAASLNSSDRKNPRRLVRAIEVASWKVENEAKKVKVDARENILNNVSVLQLGLSTNVEELKKRIKNRVEKRINEGFVDEVESLLKMGVSWKMQSMHTIGYKESEGFFKYGKTYDDFVSEWEKNEVNYVKRQMTWFKKDKRIIWIDIKDNLFFQNVEKIVKKWYSSN